MTIVRISAVIAVAALMLGACGGGDDVAVDTSTPPETMTPVASPGQTTATTPATESPTTFENSTTTQMSTTTVAPTTASAPSTPPASVDVSCSPLVVSTGETTILGELCTSDGSFTAPRPAAIVLNGCGGYESDDEITSATVRALAERGVIALRIDYLAAEPAPPDTYCEAAAVIGAVQPLLQAIVDGVAVLRSNPSVDPARVGTAAYSLGALAAMGAELGGAGLTTVTPPEFSAAALLSYPDLLPTISAAAREGRLPPLFLMTGENDTVAPSAGAQALADAATEGGIPVELVIVPDQDHPWRGEAALKAAAAMADHLAGQLGA